MLGSNVGVLPGSSRRGPESQRKLATPELVRQAALRQSLLPRAQLPIRDAAEFTEFVHVHPIDLFGQFAFFSQIGKEVALQFVVMILLLPEFLGCPVPRPQRGVIHVVGGDAGRAIGVLLGLVNE